MYFPFRFFSFYSISLRLNFIFYLNTHTHTHTHIYIYICCILTSDPDQRLCWRAWLIIWDRVKIPQYSQKLNHRKRVTSELHDSYFRLMIVKHASPKMSEVTYSGLASHENRLNGRKTII